MKNEGLAIHCHDFDLVEYCYDYAGRVNYIKENKPINEQKTRLRLFKILPDEAIQDLPPGLYKARQGWNKASQKLYKATQELYKARQEWYKDGKASQEYDKAIQERYRLNQELGMAKQEAFHQKWCGCQNWKDGKIDFNEKEN